MNVPQSWVDSDEFKFFSCKKKKKKKKWEKKRWSIRWRVYLISYEENNEKEQKTGTGRQIHQLFPTAIGEEAPKQLDF